MAKPTRKTTRRTDRKQPSPRSPGETETGGGAKADPIHNPPAPEDTNRDHPAAPGQHHGIPGAGIVGTSTADTHTTAADHPGKSEGVPKMAPGAARPDTTRSGVTSTPVQRGGGNPPGGGASRATEMASGDETAPLSTPRELAGPGGSAGLASAEVSDPNYTAASQRAQDHPAHGETRMDTGRESLNAPVTGTEGPARRVREIMTPDVEVCTPQTELYYVARMMAERDVGAIPVVESTDSMRPIGIVTDRDITVRVIAKRQDPNDLRARDVMSSDLLTVRSDSSLEDCLNQMEDRQVRRAIVIDEGGRCCGIVAQADVARRAPRGKTGELVQDVSQPPGNSARRARG